jgi:hypothetical protein
MPISDAYDRLARISLNEFADIVLQARILYLPCGDLLKLRLDIVDQSVLDVWLSASGRYSSHWERRYTAQGGLYRHDNAPHKRWANVATFPRHFHVGDEQTVRASQISPDPETALREMLVFVREKLIKERTSP